MKSDNNRINNESSIDELVNKQGNGNLHNLQVFEGKAEAERLQERENGMRDRKRRPQGASTSLYGEKLEFRSTRVTAAWQPAHESTMERNVMP